MFEIDGILYAGEQAENIKIKKAKVLTGKIMLLTFNTGEQRLFDTTELKGSAFESLKEEEILKDFSLFHGVLTWENGSIDCSSEYMYANSYKYTMMG